MMRDQTFANWLMRKFNKACRDEKHCKAHMDIPYNAYKYHNALRMKRCIREAAAYEANADEYMDAVEQASVILSRAMERRELAPATYQAVMDILKQADTRRT